MTNRTLRQLTAIATVTATVTALGLTPAFAGVDRRGGGVFVGPNTVTRPYVVPVAAGVGVTSLLTVNDAGAAGNGYELVGIPDGIGSRREGGRLVAYANHELRSGTGIVRRHGQRGAFVSKLTIDPGTKRVVKGEDFINPGVRYWNYATGRYSDTASPAWTNADGTAAPAQSAEFSRFCSGSLTDPGQLFNWRTSRGYSGQIYFANEENGDESRVFGVTTAGDAHQLPRLGLFSYENTLAAASRSDTTLVIGNEDAADGQLWVYQGRKQRHGSPVDRAGLTNGALTVADVANQAVSTDAQFRTAYGKNTPVPVRFNSIDWTQSGAAQNAAALAGGLTLNRIEDGNWDPRRPDDFYFVTTVGGAAATAGIDPVTGFRTGRDGGGLWRLRYVDIDRPELGATLTLLLDGSERVGPNAGLNNPDNITIDQAGNLLIQEDPGQNVQEARIVAYRIADGALGVVAQFDPVRFSRDAAIANTPEFLTMDEESSGIVPASVPFGRNTFLFDAQVHTTKHLPPGTGPGTAGEYVENGQLMLLKVTNWRSVYGT